MAYYDVIKDLDPVHAGILKRDLKAKSRVEGLFGSAIHKVRYDAADYPLSAAIAELLVDKGFLDRIVPLEALHEHLGPEDMKLDFHELSNVSKAFYETSDAFMSIYRRFVKKVLSEQVFGFDLYFQATPTIRFHFPLASEYDRPLHYHSDIMLGHPPQEINIWLPLTDTTDCHNFGLASLPESLALYDEFDFDFAPLAEARDTDPALQKRCHDLCAPVSLILGEMIVFDSRCLHATIKPLGDKTRISIDCRVVSVEEFERMETSYRGVGRRKMLFAPGHYFDARSSADL